MGDEHIGSRLAALPGALKPKSKQPVSTKVLNTWIAQAEGQLGDEAQDGRLGWLIASSVSIAAVQRALDADGRELFLLKGGTLLQHRLNATARTTKDVDGLIRDHRVATSQRFRPARPRCVGRHRDAVPDRPETPRSL
ncbi:MAG: hypothetical protein U0R21_02600 [Nocardioidaceae bacterium]